jgi:hypothetical protein
MLLNLGKRRPAAEEEGHFRNRICRPVSGRPIRRERSTVKSGEKVKNDVDGWMVRGCGAGARRNSTALGFRTLLACLETRRRRSERKTRSPFSLNTLPTRFNPLNLSPSLRQLGNVTRDRYWPSPVVLLEPRVPGLAITCVKFLFSYVLWSSVALAWSWGGSNEQNQGAYTYSPRLLISVSFIPVHSLDSSVNVVMRVAEMHRQNRVSKKRI